MKTPAKKAPATKKIVKKTAPLMQTKPTPKPKVKQKEQGFMDKVKSFATKVDRALEGNTTASNDTFMGYHIYGPKTGQKVKTEPKKAAPAKMKKY